jgi:hypothetical protein
MARSFLTGTPGFPEESDRFNPLPDNIYIPYQDDFLTPGIHKNIPAGGFLPAPVKSSGKISLIPWLQHQFDEGVVTFSTQIVENVGALSGAAPTGAALGIDTSSGDLYYVSSGNWTQASAGGGGSGTITFQEITNTSAPTSENYVLLNAGSSAATAVLPASPSSGQQITISVVDISNACVVDGNGNNINLSASNFSFTMTGSAIFTYNPTYGWLVS